MIVKVIKWVLRVGLFIFFVVPALVFWLWLAAERVNTSHSDVKETFDRVSAHIMAAEERSCLGDEADALEEPCGCSFDDGKMPQN